jgi:adenine-specific DNA-methyltransferase
MHTISIGMPDFSQIVDSLKHGIGEPFCSGDGYAVFCCDCVEALPCLPPDCVGLTVTSPPYNIGKEYEAPMPLPDYVAWCAFWIQQIHCATRADGAFWLNVGYVPIPNRGKAVPLPYLLWEKTLFFLMQEVVWNYGAGVAARHSLSPRNEKLLWYVKDPNRYTFNLDAIRDPDVKYPNQRKNGRLRCNTIGKNPSDVWQIAKVTSGKDRASPERTRHPAQFPLDLINRVVLGFSNPGDVVLDPFMGSGTVAVSCLRNDRFVIGLETRPDYCEIAAARIDHELKAKKSLLFD